MRSVNYVNGETGTECGLLSQAAALSLPLQTQTAKLELPLFYRTMSVPVLAFQYLPTLILNT